MQAVCQTCLQAIAEDEPRYAYEDRPMCAPCATALSQQSEPADPQDDLAALSAARARPAPARRKTARKPAKKRAAGVSPLVIAFVGVCSLAMTAGTIYLIKNDFFRERPAPKVIIETVPAIGVHPTAAPTPARS